MSKATPSMFDVERAKKRVAAHNAFANGSSIVEAASTYGITIEEVEDMIRMEFDSNVTDLAEVIAAKLDKTHHEDVELIANWLKSTMIFMFEPETDFIDTARRAVVFPTR